MTFSVSSLKYNCIEHAITWLDQLSTALSDKDNSDIYKYFDPESEDGLKGPLYPYDIAFKHKSTSWENRQKAETLIYDLKNAWLDFFDVTAKRIAQLEDLDRVRKSFDILHQTYANLVLSRPGTATKQQATELFRTFKESLVNLKRQLLRHGNPVTHHTPGPACKDFVEWYDQEAKVVSMRINDHDRIQTMTISIPNDMAWNVAVQFLVADRYPISLKNPREHGSLNLSMMFRNPKDHSDNRRLFYQCIYNTKVGSKAQYTLKPTPKAKQRRKTSHG